MGVAVLIVKHATIADENLSDVTQAEVFKGRGNVLFMFLFSHVLRPPSLLSDKSSGVYSEVIVNQWNTW